MPATPGGFHVAVWIVCGEDGAIDADRVRHTQICLVRQTPTAIHRARLLAYVLTSEDSAVEVHVYCYQVVPAPNLLDECIALNASFEASLAGLLTIRRQFV